MKNFHINHSVLTMDILKESKNYMISGFAKYLLLIYALMSALISVYHYVMSHWGLCLVFLAIAILGCVELVMMQRKMYKKYLDMLKAKDEVVFSMVCRSDYVTVHNNVEKTDEKIPYEDMKEIKETKHAYVVIGKYGEIIMINKAALKNNADEFFTLLKKKETKIKKWPRS